MSQAPSERFPDIGARGAIGRFTAGAGFAFGGVGFTLGHRPLIRLAIIPILINVLLFSFFVVGGLMQIGSVVEAAKLGLDPDAWYSFLESIWAGMVYLVSLVLTLLGGFVATVVVGNILAGPIYDLLSEKTEVIVLGRSAADPFSLKGLVGDVLQELVLLTARLILYISGLLVIFAIGLIPAVGQITSPFLSAGWSWLFLALELHNATLARHKITGSKRLGHLFNHQFGSLGFGAASWLMMWVPVMMPFLVVGATRHHLALAAYGRAPSKLTEADRALLRAA
jgi:uncharacterized protein involved in cysteine biosynthesis